jgi:PKD repeat protein
MQSLTFLIRNYKRTFANDYTPDQAFYSGNYSYDVEGPFVKSYHVNFKAEPQGEGAVSHFWDFGDGTTSTLEAPEKDFVPGGTYIITYTATYDTSCSSSLSYPLNLSPYVAGMNNLDFGYTYIGNNQVSLFADSSMGNLTWDLGNNIYSSNPSLIIRVDSVLKKICLKRITGVDTVQVCKNIAPQSYQRCNANFNQFAQPLSDPYHLSAVVIEWTDANGTTYSSKKVRQTSAQFFHVLSSSDYIANEKGQKTRKLAVEMDALLSDGVRTIEIKNMHGVIAVAYP